MKHHSFIVAFLGGALALGQCAGTAPPQEQAAIDFTVPASGLLPDWKVSAGTGKVSDAYVVLVGTFTGGVTPTTTLVGWTRTGNGPSGWEWTGPIEVPGMPSAAPINPCLRALASNGVDEIAFTRRPGLVCVLRRVNGTWEYRGDISFPVPQSCSNPQPIRAIDGDTAILCQPSSPMSIVRRQANGAWTAVSSFSGASSVRLSGDRLVYGGAVAFSGPFGDSALYDGVIQPNGTLVASPPHVAPVSYPHEFASFSVTDGTWVAVEVGAFADPRRGIAFYRYQRDGTLMQTQFVADAGGAPADIRNGRMVTSNAVWSVDGDGVWHRGAQLTPDAWQWGPSWTVGSMGLDGLRHFISGEDVVCLTADAQGVSVPELKVWKNVFDCDSNGIDDAIEIAQDPSLDCNLNGRKDSCDIAGGALPDLNDNGVPDACEADCDVNGVPDLTQIRTGAPAACDGLVLASCAIESGDADANGDGLVDACGPDLNHNGVPDFLELSNGSNSDCDGNGVPDDAPVYQTNAVPEGPAGTGFYNVGGVGVMICETFVLDPQHPTVTAVTFRIQRDTSGSFEGQFDCSAVNRHISVAIARDPNGDARPQDAEILAYTTGVATDEDWQTLTFDPVTIDTHFFFAVFTIGQKAGSTCIYLDFANCTEVHDNGDSDCQRLGYSFFSGNLPTNPQAALRACPINSNSSFFVPIAVISTLCTNPSDFNHDGLVDGFDLGMLLGTWGPASGSPCDINHDASVDGADLGLLLAAWGAVAP